MANQMYSRALSYLVGRTIKKVVEDNDVNSEMLDDLKLTLDDGSVLRLTGGQHQSLAAWYADPPEAADIEARLRAGANNRTMVGLELRQLMLEAANRIAELEKEAQEAKLGDMDDGRTGDDR